MCTVSDHHIIETYRKNVRPAQRIGHAGLWILINLDLFHQLDQRYGTWLPCFFPVIERINESRPQNSRVQKEQNSPPLLSPPRTSPSCQWLRGLQHRPVPD